MSSRKANDGSRHSTTSQRRGAKNVIVFRHDTPRLRKRNGHEQSASRSNERGTHIHVDSSVQRLKPNAFANMQDIVEVVDMSQGKLASLGVMTFHGCLNLRMVQLESLGLKCIPYGAFSGCSRLVHVELPSSILRLEGSAFSHCVSLKHVQVPPKVVQIQERAFRGCEKLAKIGWPELLFEVAAGTFTGCHSLVHVQLPSSVLSIEAGAFAGCHALTFLGLPNGLHSIGARAFQGCRSLVILTLPPTLVEIRQTAFQFCLGLMTIEVSGDKMGKLELGDGAFDGCTSLIHFALPPSKLQLGHDVFEDCSQLETQLVADNPNPRFMTLPMHGLCYHQVYFPLSNILEELSSMDPQDVSVLMGQVDCLGMTPWHILSLSSRPDKTLFECLSKVSVDKDVLDKADNLNGTPMDYLFRNPSKETGDSISYLVKWLVNNRIERLALEEWRNELSEMRSTFLQLDKAEQTRDRYRVLLAKISTRERQEILSILECAVWKMKLVSVALKLGTTTQDECVDRHVCRVSCGADQVVSNILPFLVE